MSTSFILNSTGQVVHGIPADKMNPVKPGYTNVIIPYTETEMANRRSNNFKTGHVATVKNSKLSAIKNFLV